MAAKYTGKYTKAFLSDKKIKKESLEYDFFNNKISVQENEMACIFSFKGNKLLFCKGYDKFLGIPEEEMDLLRLNSIFTEFYEKFIYELHDRVLLFLYNNNTDLESFSSHIITHVEGIEAPVMIVMKVYSTDDNGNLVSIIGRNYIDKNLITSDVVQYAFHGDFNPEFKNKIDNDLDFTSCISYTNLRVLEALETGKKMAEISTMMNIEESQLNINIQKLLKRFELKDESELIEFAKAKKLIPNQFDNYLKKN